MGCYGLLFSPLVWGCLMILRVRKTPAMPWGSKTFASTGNTGKGSLRSQLWRLQRKTARPMISSSIIGKSQFVISKNKSKLGRNQAQLTHPSNTFFVVDICCFGCLSGSYNPVSRQRNYMTALELFGGDPVPSSRSGSQMAEANQLTSSLELKFGGT